MAVMTSADRSSGERSLIAAWTSSQRAWTDASAHDAAARRLAALFRDNFKTYEAGVSRDIAAAGPV
jgi:DNA phosphorothioation-dependent restriction protein DptG